MQTSLQIALSFVSAIITDEIIPSVDQLSTQNPTIDLSPVTTRLDEISTTLAAIDYTPDTNVIVDFVVIDSAVSTIDFSGIDLNADGGIYEIDLQIVSGNSLGGKIYAFANGLTTLSLYGSSEGAGTPTIMIVNNVSGLKISGFAKLSLVGGIMTYLGMNQYASNQYHSVSMQKLAAVDNITKLTFTASNASLFGVGSRIIIRKVG
ncbi:hypothetical protein Sulku_1343 [Sulfuricurvum kujiense DSM 16994]|uniref:Uncharacterized protein n=1 Tax=Sulfuricurvum kujiense (strain ATCC BAA-921 / DSM 16994 / JCM 11577 / YK-1) TaxID=709032 RepID=E4TY86_SULKY|nr:hypothetical protein [Sulfuricurvum kujiense]ADR34006.1 hypothetical protein Sulku_1343 [Sulfuricurvum kujiense DSM 16994]